MVDLRRMTLRVGLIASLAALRLLSLSVMYLNFKRGILESIHILWKSFFLILSYARQVRVILFPLDVDDEGVDELFPQLVKARK